MMTDKAEMFALTTARERDERYMNKSIPVLSKHNTILPSIENRLPLGMGPETLSLPSFQHKNCLHSSNQRTYPSSAQTSLSQRLLLQSLAEAHWPLSHSAPTKYNGKYVLCTVYKYPTNTMQAWVYMFCTWAARSILILENEERYMCSYFSLGMSLSPVTSLPAPVSWWYSCSRCFQDICLPLHYIGKGMYIFLLNTDTHT